MTIFDDAINKIENDDNRKKFQALIDWIDKNYPNLEKAIKWSNLCYENKGTFIIGLTPYKGHISVTIEKAGIDHFAKPLEDSPYSTTEMTFRIDWDQEIDHALLEEMIDFQIEDKEDSTTYWRK